MKEEFRLFQEYPDYEVSSFGYMRRLTRGKGTWPGRVTRGAIRLDGYLGVFGFKPFNMMHQIVAHVFLGPCPEGMEPNHKDLIRRHNAASNLEYVTRSGNMKHSFEKWPEEQREALRVRARNTWVSR